MPLKLWGLSCTPAVMHRSYFDCVMKETAWKVKVRNIFAMLIIWGEVKGLCKIKGQLKVYDIMIKWAGHFEKPQKSLPKFFILNFGDIWKRKFAYTGNSVCVNIFIIKQSILLALLQLLRIISSDYRSLA